MSKVYVDDVSVGTKELCAVLGIDPKIIPNKLARIYEINPDKVRKDDQGNEKTPRRLGLPTKFNVYLKSDGKQVTVRYAREVKKENKNGFVISQYSPGQLWINGKEENVTDDTEHVFRFLHPDCFQSPFRKVGGPFRYLFKDNEAKAKLDLLKEEQEMRAMSMIIGDSALPIAQLKQIAKGMNIPGVDLLTDAEVKNTLKKLAKDKPNEFYDNATSRSIQFNGLLQDVIDKKIVTILPVNGFKRWYFTNQELCVVPSGANELEVLKEAVVKNMDLIPQFKTALDGRTVKSELEKPEFSKYFEDFNIPEGTTRQEVSPNLRKENETMEAEMAHKEDIKKLTEEEDLEIAGGEPMHHMRKKKLERLRKEVDAYRASIQTQV